MKKLCLVRHAKSSWKHLDLDDFDRPLNRRGMQDAPSMGKCLARRGVRPDALVSSPAKRAMQTAVALADGMGIPSNEIREDRRIYAASTSTLIAIIQGWDDTWERVMMVGHNPGIAEAAAVLTGEWVGHVPTCTVMELGLDVASWRDVAPGCGKLRLKVVPKVLRMDL
ncbi:MAG: histidine phosphatase family protein [Mariprofundaceae bacterium]|nr:histidine phosphatase family protein [Mariprofundaceae bacterium]